MAKYEAPSEEIKAQLRAGNEKAKQPPVVKTVEPPKQSTKTLLVSARDLMNKKFPPSEWLVDGLLRMGRKRPSLILGRPGSGKSTLALQLAVNITQGKPFLGRQTKKSDAIFWQSEESEEDIQDSLKRLGYNPGYDNNLLVYFGDPGQNNVESLRRALEEYPNVKLVVIETLDKLLKMKDINHPTAAREAFDKFDQLIGNQFYHRTAFLMVHHDKKRKGAKRADRASGSTEIVARSDAKWHLEVENDDDPRPIFNTDVRRGTNIKPTYLSFDKETQTSTLGRTVAEERKMSKEVTVDRIKEDIVKFFTLHPNSSFEHDCFRAVEGNTAGKRRSFNSLVKDGALVKSGGTGVKGSPFVYRAVEIQNEVAGEAA